MPIVTRWRTPASLIGLCLLLSISGPAAADLILTSPPRETPATGQKIYGPIAAYLTKLWGTKVVYQHPSNWLDYQRDMRHDKYDIVFDGPHFAAWRMVHLGNRVAVRLPGFLQFVLFVHADDKHVDGPEQLIGKQICTLPPPNLAALSVIDQYPNPARQPVLRGIRGGPPNLLKQFKADKCTAAVLRTQYVNKKMTDKGRAALRIIFTSKKFPNQSLTVSKRISDAQMEKMIKGLTQDPAGIAATQRLVKRFGGKAKHFIPADPAEFTGINKLLEGVVFGW
ncbi:MAG: PhnD/SsuA/transferrin family substrate-binding protein [Gammaproteobacteria bacterium]